MKQTTTKALFLVSSILVLLFPRHAQCHRVIVFPSFDGNAIHVEAYFPGGEKARKAKVLVKDSHEKVITKGLTGPEGTFTFTPPGPGTYTIFVDAGLGHGAKTSITVGKQNTGHKTKTLEGHSPKGHKKTLESSPLLKDTDNLSKNCITKEEMEGILAPLVSEIKSLRRSQEKVRTRDIIGGIGYVLGIFGIIAIIKKDKNK